MIIRGETASDYLRVRDIHLASFPESSPESCEADLVDRLRNDGDAVFSLVAIDSEKVVGHIMFSKMSAPFKALGLAPVAVLPDQRNRGIAARLIEEGIELAKKGGWDAIFVLGDPAYYERFGFTAARAAPFQSAYAGPYLMALALQENGLPVQEGVLEYAPAFAALG